jgi:hypothetical protein
MDSQFLARCMSVGVEPAGPGEFRSVGVFRPHGYTGEIKVPLEHPEDLKPGQLYAFTLAAADEPRNPDDAG